MKRQYSEAQIERENQQIKDYIFGAVVRGFLTSLTG